MGCDHDFELGQITSAPWNQLQREEWAYYYCTKCLLLELTIKAIEEDWDEDRLKEETVKLIKQRQLDIRKNYDYYTDKIISLITDLIEAIEVPEKDHIHVSDKFAQGMTNRDADLMIRARNEAIDQFTASKAKVLGQLGDLGD